MEGSGALPLRTTQEPPRPTQSPTPAPAPQVEPPSAEDPLEAAWRAGLAERFPRTDWHALWADESVEEWLHQPLVGRARSVVIYSPPKVGKSLLALELAVSLVTGVTWLDSTPPRRLRVLLLDFENSPRDDLRVRLRAMGVRPDDLAELVLLSFPAMAGLDTVRGSQELLAIVELWQPDLVMVDTVSRVIQGEENSNDTWLQIYRLVGLPLKALGIAVLRLDHSGKDEAKGMRGGSAKYGDVDAVWRLSEVVRDKRYRLECTQSRMAIAQGQRVLDLERRAEPLQHVLLGQRDLSPYDAKVAEAVGMADSEGLPNGASSGDVERVCRARGGRWATDVYREAARLRRARNGGQAVDKPDLSTPGQAPDLTADLTADLSTTPAAHLPRSDLTYEAPGQDRSGAAETLTAYLPPSGAVAKVGHPGKGGWRNVGPGPRVWVDFTTGQTYDAPQE